LGLILALGALVAATHLVAASQVVTGTVPPITASLRPLGPLDPNQQLNLAIALPLRNPQGLEELLQKIYDPGSTNFRNYLTPAQFRAGFGPAEEDYQAVVAFAQGNNLTVTYEHSNRLILDVAAAVSNIEAAFNIHMLVYQDPTEARTFYAPDADPTLDVAAPVQGIEGLSDYFLPQHGGIATPLDPGGYAVQILKAQALKAITGAGISGAFTLAISQTREVQATVKL
jgi:subtilase family serine protease